MPSIRVIRTFEIPEKNDFVLVGEIQGAVGSGDFVRIPVTPEGNRMNFYIDRIEFEQSRPEVELHIGRFRSIVEILRGLPLVGQTFEIEDFWE
jgi:hypothetical protein